MAIDTPARIAILGAGPIGLEAALYARFLGYEVEIFEQGLVGEHVRRWGHVRMYTPFRSIGSPLGLAALKAQDPAYEAPEEEAYLSGNEWLDRYLLPLAETDLLADSLRLGMRAVAISNRDFRKTEGVDDEARAEAMLRVVLRDGNGIESDTTADIVIDASGVLGTPNWIGPGGGPALGELQHRSRIQYGPTDIGAAARSLYAGQRVLLVGDDFAAAATLAALCDVAADKPETRVTWVPGPRPEHAADEPLSHGRDPCFAERAARMAAAREQAARLPVIVTRRDDVQIIAVSCDEERGVWSVHLGGASLESAECDQIIACVGHRPDHELYRELQVRVDEVFDRPVAPQEAGDSPGFGRTPAIRPENLVLREPNFYVLGAKRYGRSSDFLFADGLEQIRAIFSVIGDRAELDLYGNLRRTL